MSSKLVGKREELAAKQKFLHEIFAAAGKDLDFEKVKNIEGDSAAKATKIQELNQELEDVAKECEELVELEKISDRVNEIGDQLKAPAKPAAGITHPTGEQPKSVGEQIVSLGGYKRFLKDGKPAGNHEIGRIDAGLRELKTTFTTTAGWAPESLRTGRIIEEQVAPIQVLDIIPTAPTSMTSVVYMEETTVTFAAAERNEEAVYAESTFALTEQSSAVRSIGHFVPVTDEQLEDVPAVQAYLNQRLIFGLRQRLDTQVLVGDGAAPNLRGILNVVGIQTQAKDADTVPDAVYKAIVLCRVTGRSFPGVVVFHPNDWQDVRLLRTADGIYIWGNPSEAGPERIWGLRVVQSDQETENTALVGDFATFCSLFEKRGVDIQVGYIDDDFKKGRRSIRAGLRVAFVVYRPAAFVTVTGV